MTFLSQVNNNGFRPPPSVVTARYAEGYENRVVATRISTFACRTSYRDINASFYHLWRE